MLNQLRFKRDDFREFIIHYHKTIIEKNDIINALYNIALIVKQTNNIVYNY